MRRTKTITRMRIGEIQPADALRGDEARSKESSPDEQFDSHAIHCQAPIVHCATDREAFDLVVFGKSPNRKLNHS